MKDPRKAPRFPGLSTHYTPTRTRTIQGVQYVETAYPVCGVSYVVPERRSEDPLKTNCRRCLKTKAWRAAWKKLEEA